MRTEGDSDIEKRLLLAILLSMAVLFGTPYIYQKLNLVTPIEVQESTPAESKDSEPINVGTSAKEDTERETLGITELEPTQAAPRVIEIETEDLKLLFNNVGAGLQSARLMKYQSGEEPLEVVLTQTDAGGDSEEEDYGPGAPVASRSLVIPHLLGPFRASVLPMMRLHLGLSLQPACQCRSAASALVT